MFKDGDIVTIKEEYLDYYRGHDSGDWEDQVYNAVVNNHEMIVLRPSNDRDSYVIFCESFTGNTNRDWYIQKNHLKLVKSTGEWKFNYITSKDAIDCDGFSKWEKKCIKRI